MYKAIWAAAIGEELVCTREATNAANRYAMAVTKQETIIGHLTKRFLRYVRCSYEEEAPYAVQ